MRLGPSLDLTESRRARSTIVTGDITAARVINRANMNGGILELDIKGLASGGTYALAPLTTPKVTLTVTSPGYDSAGAATTVTRTVWGTVALRKPYPNETANDETVSGSDVTVRLALSELIYADDTVTLTCLSGLYTAGGTPSNAKSSFAVTNQSTKAAPLVIARWLTVPFQKAGSSFDVELCVVHQFGRSNKMVNAVKFIATGRTSAATSNVTVTSMAASNVATRAGYKVPVFRGTVDLSGMTQGELVDIKAICYPFIGASFDTATYGEAWPSPNLTQYCTVLCDKAGNYSSAIAYVSTTGNDGTGVVSSNAATAAASPFATLKGAGDAIKTWNNANGNPTHNDCDGGEIRLMSGTHTGLGATWQTTHNNKCWLKVTYDPSAGLRVPVIQANSGQKLAPNMVWWNGLTINAITSNTTFVDGLDSSSIARFHWVDACDSTGINSGGPLWYRLTLFATNYNASQIGDIAHSSASKQHYPLHAGCTYDGRVEYYGMFGCYWSGATHPLDVSNLATAAVTPVGEMFVGNVCKPTGSGAYLPGGMRDIGARGYAIVQNVFERYTSVNVTVRFSGDGLTNTVDNAVLAYNTSVGGRWNMLYNDSGTAEHIKYGVALYNLTYEFNNKRDTFPHPTDGKNGNRVGNWSVSHHCGFKGNVVMKNTSNGDSTANADSWFGEFFNLDETNLSLSNATQAADGTAVGFVDYKAITTNGTAGTGGGNYNLTSSSTAKSRVRSGMSMLPIDIAGNARLNNGVGACGAYEAAA